MEMQKNNLPNMIYADDKSWYTKSPHMHNHSHTLIEYHHSRIVEALKAENEELRNSVGRCIGIPILYGFCEPVEGYVKRPQDLERVLYDMGKAIEQLHRQNEELKAKLDKAKDALLEVCGMGDTTPFLRARNCLSEIEE